MRNWLIKLLAGKRTIVINANIDGNKGIVIKDTKSCICNVNISNTDVAITVEQTI